MATKIKITFLGTADAIPSVRRNHSAVFLSYDAENILFDCGEGTQRQFRKARLNPGKVTRILITHLHGDHVLGLPGLMQTLSLSNYNKTLYIYGPKGTKQFVREMLNTFKFQENYPIKVEEVSGNFFENKHFYLEAEKMIHGIPCNAYNFVKKGKLRIDKKKLKKSGLPEGPLLSKIIQGKDVVYQGKKFKSKALTYQDKDLKVSFVMDTLDNKRIVPFVKGADVFVSESTFSLEEKDKAEKHKHLTSEQAAKIAKKAKVGKLILTHISARYDKNPKKILLEAKKIFRKSEVVKDLDVLEVE